MFPLVSDNRGTLNINISTVIYEIMFYFRFFQKDGATVVVDSSSLEMIKGSTIDFHTELIQSAFRVIDNPQAAKGCSCGASFELKF